MARPARRFSLAASSLPISAISAQVEAAREGRVVLLYLSSGGVQAVGIARYLQNVVARMLTLFCAVLAATSSARLTRTHSSQSAEKRACQSSSMPHLYPPHSAIRRHHAFLEQAIGAHDQQVCWHLAAGLPRRGAQECRPALRGILR